MNGWWALVIVICAPTVAAVLLVLLSPKTPPPGPAERCMFEDHAWIIGGKSVGKGTACNGRAKYALAFWDGHPAAELTGRLVCDRHVIEADELAVAIARDSVS